MPVRSTIHSSDVSTIFASSSFVITRSGTCVPNPVIETGAAAVRRADHDCSTAKVSVPRAASLPSTLRRRLAAPDRAAHPLQLALELELVARLDDALEAHVVDAREERDAAAVLLLASTATAPVCAIASTISTPGMTGRPGNARRVPLVLAHALARHHASPARARRPRR